MVLVKLIHWRGAQVSIQGAGTGAFDSLRRRLPIKQSRSRSNKFRPIQISYSMTVMAVTGSLTLTT